MDAINIEEEFAIVKRGRPRKRVQTPGEDPKEVSREYMREYYGEHKDQYKNYFKKYYEKNKEKIIKKASVKVMCESCGFEVTKTYMKKHVLSKKHIEVLERKEKAKLAQEQQKAPEVQV